MADNGRHTESGSGDGDSTGTLWRVFRRLFQNDGDQSLRAQIEDVINEHEGDADDSGPANGDLSQLERQMLRNLLHFSEHDADDVAVPRSEIVAIPASASWAEVVEAFAEHGHSRMPVYGESLDAIKGMIHIKDVFPILARGEQPPEDWSALLRQPLYVPQSRGALDVLVDMRAQRTHLAVVIDEYTGTDGIITIEDLVEEIVGNIEDEHDDAPEELLISQESGIWDADARVELDDVAERIDPRLAEVEEAVDTLGGLAFVLAGQVPQVGTVLEHDSGWRIEVTDGDERRVTRLRLHPPATESAEETD
ncbi:hemolysin family protein [Novosphingobium aerophilum]|uniref:hemolysin family protein n=1 Tax=Novosphingobium TaxID=165696 RepID=UPI0006C869FA|nr:MULTISPECIES: hemolysin family protein [unclassified Novosphingobium]KPH64471.1 cobalt transporter [Novosphingobium sp. ST904]MPS68727.1 HlyC/CorC family transporter [Novosphingobium sp.]TCM31108.1 CBS domain protein [Novosphingobium sp. ST904]WRT93551.1 hemolysin family protein [Novosphingobium sp. RL4]